MTLLTCAAVRRRLPAFYDRELPVRDMIDLESHVGDCPPCASELKQLREVGDSLRLAAAPAPADDWTGVQSGVISRMRAEAHESWAARAGRMFDDLHLLWIGLASTAATFLCGAVALSALHFASPDRDDSLRSMIAVISAPVGSDLNPVIADQFLTVPSVPDQGPIQAMLAQPVSHDELVLALSAVVTREGRVSSVFVLNNQQHRAEINPILDVLARGRLEPGRVGTAAVAVNFVWLMTHTTVKAKAPRTI
jgi:anti-sigma factor RsiW